MKIYLDDFAVMPTRAHETDAGLDLYAPDKIIIRPRDSVVVDTGVHVEIPEHCCGLMVSKSGLNVKQDITSTGLIDEGYTGSIKVKLYNHGLGYQYIEKGKKISQLVIFPVCFPDIELVDKLSLFRDSERGQNGFGSTDK